MTTDEEWLLREKYHGVPGPDYDADCARLRSGEPLAYVIGHQPFLSAKINLASRPLIPRPETEFWVAEYLNHVRAQAGSGFTGPVLDLCAGSGCIGVAVAMAFPDCVVDFVEIDEGHHSTIKRNCTDNCGPSRPVQIMGGHLFSQVTGRYQAILSNPPYIDMSLGRVAEAVREFEPALALDGGRAGFDCLSDIITTAPAYLMPGGELWIEHEPEQVTLIQTAATPRYQSVSHHPDQYGVCRYSVLVVA
jgi:release factor glutamine methyltransferase